MKIVVNYEESFGTQDYMNDILEAVETVNNKHAIALDMVSFINYPTTAVADVFSCIRQAASTGIVCFTNEGIIYKKSDEPLKVEI